MGTFTFADVGRLRAAVAAAEQDLLRVTEAHSPVAEIGRRQRALDDARRRLAAAEGPRDQERRAEQPGVNQ